MTDPIVKILTIEADPATVWRALTDPAILAVWMVDDSAAVDLRIGGRFSLFAGATTGQFTEIDPPKTLAYTWRQSTWPSAWPDSHVRWELRPAGSATALTLTHTDFPTQAERDSHDEGWDIYWLEAMVDYLEPDTLD